MELSWPQHTCISFISILLSSKNPTFQFQFSECLAVKNSDIEKPNVPLFNNENSSKHLLNSTVTYPRNHCSTNTLRNHKDLVYNGKKKHLSALRWNSPTTCCPFNCTVCNALKHNSIVWRLFVDCLRKVHSLCRQCRRTCNESGDRAKTSLNYFHPRPRWMKQFLNHVLAQWNCIYLIPQVREGKPPSHRRRLWCAVASIPHRFWEQLVLLEVNLQDTIELNLVGLNCVKSYDSFLWHFSPALFP